MNTYQDIKASRRLVVAGAAIGYLIVAAAGVLFVVNRNDGVPGMTWQIPAWLIVLAIPPTWAIRSLDRRPSLLTAATYAALALGVFETLGGLFLPVHLVVAIVWAFSTRRRPRRAPEPIGSAWKRPLLALAVVVPALLMYAHLDPVCVTTMPDGSSVTTVDTTAPSGWRIGSTIIGTSSSTTGFEPDAQTCWNDSIVLWEGLLGLVAAGLGMAAGWRWPSNDVVLESRGGTTSVSPRTSQ